MIIEYAPTHGPSGVNAIMTVGDYPGQSVVKTSAQHPILAGGAMFLAAKLLGLPQPILLGVATTILLKSKYFSSLK